MNRVNFLLAIVAFLLTTSSISSQVPEYFIFSFEQKCHSEEYCKFYSIKETYSKTDSESEHLKKIIFPSDYSIKLIKLKNDREIENTIVFLDSLLKLNVLTISIDNILFDSIKSNLSSKNHYKINDQDIDAFISTSKLYTFDLQALPLEYNGIRVRGGLNIFLFTLGIKIPGFDTSYWSLNASTIDFLYYKEYKIWLPLYLAYKKHKFFKKSLKLDEYFSAARLEKLICWAIVNHKEKQKVE